MSAETIAGIVEPAPAEVAVLPPRFEIADKIPGRSFNVKHIGHFTTEKVVFSDGVSYEKRLCEPHRQQYDTPVSFTTPWFTNVDGFNTEIGKALTAEGIPTVIIGPPDIPPSKFAHLHKIGLLAHDAEANQQILDSETGMAGLQFDKIISYGYSRGGMAGFGILATAATHRRDIAYFDFMDPCLEHPLGLADGDPRRLAGYIGREVLEAARTIVTSNNRRNLLATFKISPGTILQHVNVGVALFRGEAGPLANQVPRQAVGRITLFDSSRLNHAEEWARHFADFPHVAVVKVPGYHLSGVDFVKRRDSIRRIALAEQLIQQGLPLESVDWAQPPAA